MIIHTYGNLKFSDNGNITGNEPGGKKIPNEAWVGFYEYQRDHTNDSTEKGKLNKVVEMLKANTSYEDIAKEYRKR